MSNTIRQSNIFGDYDWKIAYESFLEADYAAYDYDSIYQSMVEYIKNNYSDDFNDFIQHSELLAHVNMLAYLGQGYAFRNDVNTKQNFMDDAIRRENVIKIASTLTYRVKRNVAANGMLKINSLRTTDTITDSDGLTLQNRRIYWNQRGNPTWYDSFIKILESAFKRDNRFGKPLQSLSGSSRYELYELNQPIASNYVYPFNQSINGDILRFEIVPTSIIDNEIVERPPSTDDPFTIVYQNNGKGSESSNTGFFVQVKQGHLQSRDFTYSSPKIDRSELIDIDNINDTDIWVHEIDQEGHLIEYWHDIPVNTGQNIIYNQIDLTERNVYFSKTLAEDRVEILYGDGNFSKAPTNHMRVWVRQSVNQKYGIRKHDLLDVQIDIPYVNNNGKPNTLTVFLTNEDDILNADVSESLAEMKDNINSNHYQQERMVTIEDYNIFPFQRNPLRKITTLNRNNTGKSRYPFLDTFDPTGMHSNLFVNAVDGYIFDEYYEISAEIATDNMTFDSNTITQDIIEPLLKRTEFKTFYNNTVFHENFKEHPTNYMLGDNFPCLIWSNTFISSDNGMGNIVFSSYNVLGDPIWENLALNDYPIIRPLSKLLFLHDNLEYWTTVITVDDTITVTDHIPDNAHLYMVIPSPSFSINTQTKQEMLSLINKEESFGLRFDDITNDWIVIPQNNITTTNTRYDTLEPQSTITPDNRWLIKCIFNRDLSHNYYMVTVRGSRMVFGSDKQVRFFFKNTDVVRDIKTGTPVMDKIDIKHDDETYGVNDFKPVHDEYISNKHINIEYIDEDTP